MWARFGHRLGTNHSKEVKNKRKPRGYSSDETLCTAITTRKTKQKGHIRRCGLNCFLERETGFEPATSTLARFNNLSILCVIVPLLICLTYDDTGLMKYRLTFLDHPDCSSSRRESLAAALLYNISHGRQALFVVSQLLGHAGPEVSLLHYCHLLEWQLATALSNARHEPVLSLKVLKQLTGWQNSWIYQLTGTKWIASSCLNSAVKEFSTTHYDPVMYLANKAESEPIPDKLIKSIRTEHEWHIVYELLYRLAKGEGDESNLSKRFCVPIETINTWQLRAGELFSLNSPQGILRNVTESSVAPTDKFPFPKRLVHKEEKKLITTIFQAVSTLKNSEMRFVRAKACEFAKTFRIYIRENQFPTIRPARSFLRLMRLIGIPETSI